MELNGYTGEFRVGGGSSSPESIDGEILVFNRNQEADETENHAIVWINGRGGIVKIRSIVSNDVVERISLDGSTAGIKVGGNQRDGKIELFDHTQDQLTSNFRISLDTENNQIVVRNDQNSDVITLDGRNNQIVVRNDHQFDPFTGKPQTKIIMNGESGAITLFKNFHPVITLDPNLVNLELGGGGTTNSADIFLYPSGVLSGFSPNHTVQFSGGNEGGGGIIYLKNMINNKNTIIADGGNGILKLGGTGLRSGVGGNILLFPSHVDINDTSQSSIHLDGQIGKVALRAWGADTISLEKGTIRVGGNEYGGGDGKILFFSRFMNNNANESEANITISAENNGDITFRNADCAEEFDAIDEDVEEGDVLILNSNEDGLIRSVTSYDKRVVGVHSGAGNLKPGIILDRQINGNKRIPVALMGKVFCKVDADYASIEGGDILTSSDTEGHAMKVLDPRRSFGTVIGKALKSIKSGKGLIPILVSRG